MLGKVRKVRSRTDYILGTDHRICGKISVRDPQHNSDHYMVLGCLPSASLTEHKWYLRVRKTFPLKPPTEPTIEDDVFAALRRAVPKARAREARQNEWISTETWRLVDERVSARRDPEKGHAIKRRLGRAIKMILENDRRHRADEAGEEVEALVGSDPPIIKEDWHSIQGWYKSTVNRALPPARVTLERITAERVAMYSYVPPPEENIPFEIHPFQVNDLVPEEGEIEWAIKQLRNNRSRGPSRMRTEHVKLWLTAAR